MAGPGTAVLAGCRQEQTGSESLGGARGIGGDVRGEAGRGLHEHGHERRWRALVVGSHGLIGRHGEYVHGDHVRVVLGRGCGSELRYECVRVAGGA